MLTRTDVSPVRDVEPAEQSTAWVKAEVEGPGTDADGAMGPVSIDLGGSLAPGPPRLGVTDVVA